MSSPTAVIAVLAAALAVSGIARAGGAGTGTGTGLGAGDNVPAKLALLVMLKVLTYDKNLAARGEGDFVVYVATEAGQDEARREVELAANDLAGASLRARPVKFVYGEIGDAAALKRQLESRKAQAVLLLPGVTPDGVRTVQRVAAETRVYTLSLDPRLVEKSLALGVANEAGRPRIVLNLEAAKQVNASFEPAILKLARIFH